MLLICISAFLLTFPLVCDKISIYKILEASMTQATEKFLKYIDEISEERKKIIQEENILI